MEMMKGVCQHAGQHRSYKTPWPSKSLFCEIFLRIHIWIHTEKGPLRESNYSNFHALETHVYVSQIRLCPGMVEYGMALSNLAKSRFNKQESDKGIRSRNKRSIYGSLKSRARDIVYQTSS